MIHQQAPKLNNVVTGTEDVIKIEEVLVAVVEEELDNGSLANLPKTLRLTVSHYRPSSTGVCSIYYSIDLVFLSLSLSCLLFFILVFLVFSFSWRETSSTALCTTFLPFFFLPNRAHFLILILQNFSFCFPFMYPCTPE